MCLTVSHTWTWTDARKLSHSVIVCRLAIYRPAYAVCLFVLHARQGTCETVCVERVRELAGVSCVTWPLYCSASLGPCTVESRVRSGLITALSCCARSSPDRPVRAALGTRAALSPRSLRLRDGTWEMRCRPLLQQPHLVLYFTHVSNAKLYKQCSCKLNIQQSCTIHVHVHVHVHGMAHAHGFTIQLHVCTRAAPRTWRSHGASMVPYKVQYTNATTFIITQRHQARHTVAVDSTMTYPTLSLMLGPGQLRERRQPSREGVRHSHSFLCPS